MTVPSRLTGALSDRYRLERELGQGGMATVYLAEDLKHGRKVAIKVLHPDRRRAARRGGQLVPGTQAEDGQEMRGHSHQCHR